uniref:Uncharacterized protein n=1 Tax=viral metagenome TaxID=1070528 RepID=A0A6C0HN18_9ZZZZ
MAYQQLNAFAGIGNTYTPNMLHNSFKTEATLGSSSFNNARNATSTNVIPRQGFNQKILNNNNTGFPQDSINRESNQTDFFMSPLSGESVRKEAFHDNMIPFIKNKNQQSMSFDTNSTMLGKFTGQDVDRRPKKKEIASFFDLTPNNSFPYGSPSFTESIDMDRYIPSQKRQNEKPFQDIRVGPGLAAGYTAEPIGGLTQSNARDYVLPKSVDELRCLTNPRISYNGRIIAGLKSAQRGLQAKPFKHRPETYYNSTPERGTLSSAVKASQLREKYYMKPTNKQFQKPYFGGLGQSDKLKPRKEGAYRQSTKNNYMNPAPRNAYREDAWSVADTPNEVGVGDYGKHSWDNRANERDVTQQRTNYNSITMAVKKITTPLTDFFRRTRKENFIGNMRPDGNMTAAMPSKLTVYDPTDITRTTIKEQNIDNDYVGNLSAEKKSIAYDPNDIARTTIKEQNIHNDNPYINMNPQQPRSTCIYDPEDIAKTTLRETTIDHDHIGFMGSQERLKNGGYTSTSIDMKNTNRQFTTDWYYQGIANGEVGTGTGRGYLAARYQAKNTNRQFLNDWEWEGPAKYGTDRPMSYDSAYNAHSNPNREEIAVGRAPTEQGTKLNAGMDWVNLEHHKIEADQINIREPAETFIFSAPPQKNNCGLTRVKSKLPEDTIRHRIDPDILDAYRENPYTQSLSSAIFA